jgi:NAD(P)-dependent dehydrogenase (short-subunit alcohol dehydrogenase family)
VGERSAGDLLGLRGRRAVVTGGAAGIGGAVASRLTAEGSEVMIADVDAAIGQQTARRLGARFVAVDLSTLDGVRAMISAARREFGGLDVLVNNAGGVVKPVYPGAPAEHWLRMLDLNLRGVMLSTQLAIDVMRPGGAIVNIASTAGLGYGVHGVPEYAVAKAGVMRLTACLAPLWDSRGIRVNCVCPGLTDTPSWRRDLANMTPAERASAPPAMRADEIADAVSVMLTDENLAGRVMVCQHGQPRRMLPASDWSEYVDTLAEQNASPGTTAPSPADPSSS